MREGQFESLRLELLRSGVTPAYVERTVLELDGKALVIDRVGLEAGDEGRTGAWGWGSRSVYGCLLATGASDELIRDVRDAVRPAGEGDLFAATHVGSVMVCRFLGSSAERARAIYAKARANYHPIAIASLDPIVLPRR